jgi:hypothetical protein
MGRHAPEFFGDLVLAMHEEHIARYEREKEKPVMSRDRPVTVAGQPSSEEAETRPSQSRKGASTPTAH